MFERFTDRARQVIVLAHDESSTLKHNYIGTEHILLGLLREDDGSAAGALASLGITVERARAEVSQILGIGEEFNAGQLPFTDRANSVLKLALSEARAFDLEHVEPGHIMLSLLSEGQGVAARVLADLGADAELLRAEVIRRMDALNHDIR